MRSGSKRVGGSSYCNPRRKPFTSKRPWSPRSEWKGTAGRKGIWGNARESGKDQTCWCGWILVCSWGWGGGFCWWGGGGAQAVRGACLCLPWLPGVCQALPGPACGGALRPGLSHRHHAHRALCSWAPGGLPAPPAAGLRPRLPPAALHSSLPSREPPPLCQRPSVHFPADVFSGNTWESWAARCSRLTACAAWLEFCPRFTWPVATVP